MERCCGAGAMEREAAEREAAEREAAERERHLREEVEALVKFKYATGHNGTYAINEKGEYADGWYPGKRGTDEGWGQLDFYKQPCRLVGVQTYDGYVTEIHRSDYRLQGTLKDGFMAFTRLRCLNLENTGYYPDRANNLTGVFPTHWPASLEHLNVANNNLTGVFPTHWPASLKSLNVANNNLTGVLPTCWPTSLNFLNVSGNPNLAGVISKELILQCQSIDYSNCKKAWNQVTKSKNKDYMQGPFIVGVSFASEHIGFLLGNRELRGISADMLRDVPKKGDPAMQMTRTHGDKWVAWQEVWLTGLKALQNQRVTVLSDAWDDDGNPFKKKFEEKTSDDKNLQNCFDPTYLLPDGEKAWSILDWERRQILAVSKTNNLTIEYTGEDGEAEDRWGPYRPPDWYESPLAASGQAEWQQSKQCCVCQ